MFYPIDNNIIYIFTGIFFKNIRKQIARQIWNIRSVNAERTQI